MNRKAKTLSNQALKLIETTRFRMGVSEFIHAFIDEWAYLQTGLYKPSRPIPEDLASTAKELSQLLAGAMRADPTNDVMGYVFCDSGFYKRGTDFYPTPREVSKLMTALIQPSGAGGSNEYSEICCGTGSITLAWLEDRMVKQGLDAMKDVQLYLEDVDPVMVKACMLQLLYYFETRGVSPALLHLDAVNTITRRYGGVSYYAYAPTQMKQEKPVREPAACSAV